MAKSLMTNPQSKVVTSLAVALACMISLSVLLTQHMRAEEPGAAPVNPTGTTASATDPKRTSATDKTLVASGRIVALRTTPLDLASIAITDFGDHVDPAKSETR